MAGASLMLIELKNELKNGGSGTGPLHSLSGIFGARAARPPRPAGAGAPANSPEKSDKKRQITPNYAKSPFYVSACQFSAFQENNKTN
jgi:hypothetical protein